MPYRSQAQQGLFHSPNSPVGPAEVAKWDAESKGQQGLPPHVGSVKWRQKSVKPMARGGPISAGKPYFVGEKGPELLIPRTSGHIIPHERAPFPRLPKQPRQDLLHNAIMRGMGGLENIPSKLPGLPGTT